MKEYRGKIVTANMTKTVVIEQIIAHPHPLYKKVVKRRRHLKAHSEMLLTSGDVVKFVPTRPLSKEKHFRVVEKVG